MVLLPCKVRNMVLGMLVLQTTSIVLLMRYSKARAAPPYLSSVAVVFAEALKLPFCVAMTARAVGWDGRRLRTLLQREVLLSADTLRLAVPALGFTFQNNLLFLALANLEAPTYQVTYQSKTLFTALFSRLLLGRALEVSQWVALVLLALGAVLVSDLTAAPRPNLAAMSPTVGISAVLVAAVLSASSSVYFEKLLKAKRERAARRPDAFEPIAESQGSPKSYAAEAEAAEAAEAEAYARAVESASLWLRNIQLGAWALPLAAIVARMHDADAIDAGGLLQGFDHMVWLIVLLNGCGGLLVAATMKYADNIVKCFAAAMAILCGTVLSVPLFNFVLSPLFVAGALITAVATVLYSSAPPLPSMLRQLPFMLRPSSPRRRPGYAPLERTSDSRCDGPDAIERGGV